MRVIIKKYLLSIVFFLSFFSAFPQQIRKVEIIRANSLEYDRYLGIEAKRLLGDVVFKHEDAYMFCDSAYFFDASNTIKAFNNVKINQGDSLSLSGKYLEYDGNTKMAKMRDSVVLRHNNSFLNTDSLNYDRITDVAYYYDWGKIFDGENTLESRRGYYYTRFKDYYAVDSVILENPQYIMYSDTLKYNTESAISYFYGPTNIVSDSNLIYCENGYYNTRTDVAGFSENAYLRSGSNFLKGDSLYYDRKIRYGEAFKNVSVIDTAENINAYGDYAFYFENPQKAMLTQKTLVEYVIDEDTVFFHSDTVFISKDTSGNKLIRAYYKVQAYKSDFQAACDSLVFYSKDSIARLFNNPILWGENAQITADNIQMHVKEKDPDWFFLDGNAFAILEQDSSLYNQVLSRTIFGTVKDKQIETLRLKNNCQTIYYVVDEDTNEVIAFNKVVSSNMKVLFKNNKLNKIWFYENPDGRTIPIEQITNEQKFLNGFNWRYDLRPKSRYDIFIWKL